MPYPIRGKIHTTPRRPTNRSSETWEIANYPKPRSTYQGSCSCFGCLLTVIGFIGMMWIAFHVTEILQFITG